MKMTKFSGSGWFNESMRHRLARLGIKTQSPRFIMYIQTKPITNKFQNQNQEMIVQFGDWQVKPVQKMLTDSGDIFREISKPGDQPSNKYILEKLKMIEPQLSEESDGEIYNETRGEVYNDKTPFKLALQKDKSLLNELNQMWTKQPTKNQDEKLAKQLNIHILQGEWQPALRDCFALFIKYWDKEHLWD